MQSRDPFSGDCDHGHEALQIEKEAAPLAEPRPVLRGLRRRPPRPPWPRRPPPCRAETRSQGIATDVRRSRNRSPPENLAEPRPVLRGLRPLWDGKQPTRGPPSCRAETRSQGIATPLCGPPGPRRSPNACRAETRSQGIATGFDELFDPEPLSANLAEPRPVLRGLRRECPRTPSQY